MCAEIESNAKSCRAFSFLFFLLPSLLTRCALVLNWIGPASHAPRKCPNFSFREEEGTECLANVNGHSRGLRRRLHRSCVSRRSKRSKVKARWLASSSSSSMRRTWPPGKPPFTTGTWQNVDRIVTHLASSFFIARSSFQLRRRKTPESRTVADIPSRSVDLLFSFLFQNRLLSTDDSLGKLHGHLSTSTFWPDNFPGFPTRPRRAGRMPFPSRSGSTWWMLVILGSGERWHWLLSLSLSLIFLRHILSGKGMRLVINKRRKREENPPLRRVVVAARR